MRRIGTVREYFFVTFLFIGKKIQLNDFLIYYFRLAERNTDAILEDRKSLNGNQNPKKK